MENNEFQQIVLTELAVIKEQLKPMQEHVKDGHIFRDKIVAVITQTKFQWFLIAGLYSSIIGSIVWIIRSKI